MRISDWSSDVCSSDLLYLPAIRAVGYRQAWEHLEGGSTAGEFRDRAIHATRQLAKRQLTWLRGELDARWFDPASDQARLDDALGLFLGSHCQGTPVQMD